MNILDIFFPKKCLGCGKTGLYFCEACFSIQEKPKQICPVCERFQPFGETHSFCKTKYSLDGLVYFYNYQGIIRNAIHKLKYRYVTQMAYEINEKVINRIANDEAITLLLRNIELNKPTVIPIPLFWYKENQRGFNQADLFGRALAKKFNLMFENGILKRSKPTVSQTRLSYEDRKKNVEGIFSVMPSVLFFNPSVLLVDDVWTTGSTMKEASRVLKEAGVSNIWGITIAR